MRAIYSVLLFVGVVTFLWAFTPWQIFGTEIWDYPAECMDSPWIRGKPCKQVLTLNRSKYDVDVDRQSVVHTMPGIDDIRRAFGRCDVRSRVNWSCVYEDKSGCVTMVDGRLLRERRSDFLYLNKWQWWGLHLFDDTKNWIGSYAIPEQRTVTPESYYLPECLEIRARKNK